MIGTILRIRYELIQELYQHPLFVAYVARDRVAGRNVCVRLIRPEFAGEKAFVEKLREIVYRYKSLKHPLIENYIEVDEHEGVPFIVSEVFRGQLLSDRIEKLAPFSPHFSVALALSISEALQVLHQGDMVHGDVAPYHIACSQDGKVTLLLPGLWESFSSSRLVGEKVLPLMVPYLAPEIHTYSPPTSATDIYSLGVILYELLTGHPPYSADTVEGMALKHSTAPVPSLRARNPAIPTALEEFLKKNLAKPPQDRYQSTQDLCEDLRSLQNALRFGKPVTLKHLNSPVKTQTSAGPLKPQKEAPLEELKVAPKMSALRQPKTKRGTKLDNDRISKILATSVYTGLVILVLMIGGWIYFNLSKPRLIRVPNLVGLNLNEANLRLQEMHLGLKISRHEPSEHYPEGAIIDVNPAPGQDVRENAYVFVTVSSGSRFVEVPDVRGLSVGEAKSILGTVSLSVEDPGRPVRSVNVEPGKIAAQIPEPRRKVERHSKVRVQVSGGPDVSGPTYTQTGERHSYTIRIKMPIVNSKTLLRVDMTDERGTRTVYEQLHSSSDVIECRAEGYGREVIFRIFGDGELLEQVQKTIQGTNQGTRQETKAADVSQTTGQTVGSYGAQP